MSGKETDKTTNASQLPESELQKANEALRESNRRLELLSDTSRQLLVTEDPQGLVQSLCEKIMAVLDCHAFFNFLVDEQRGCLHLNAFAGIPPEVGKSIEWLDYGAAICGCVARDGHRIVAEDIFNNPDPRTDLVMGYGIQAYACNPLLTQGGKVIGTLSFGSRTRTCFSEDDLDLMKTVTDQVAIAMERIRLLDLERRRAQALEESEARLRLALTGARAGVWEWDYSSGNMLFSRELYELMGLDPSQPAPSILEYSAMLHPGDRDRAASLFKRALASKQPSIEMEFRVIRPDGQVVWIGANGRILYGDDGHPVRAYGINQDISERKRAEEREKDLEAHKREFYRRTLQAATQGKLIVCEPEDIEEIAGEPVVSWKVRDRQEIGAMRDSLLARARDLGLCANREHGFAVCGIEAVANCYKHAGGGVASLHKVDDSLVLKVSDAGPGIEALVLPDVALKQHYTTAVSLGMGYKVMIEFADKVYLATGPEGTTVAISMKLSGNGSTPKWAQIQPL